MGDAQQVESPRRDDFAHDGSRTPRRRSPSRRRSSSRTRGRLRALYFSLAAVWGFLAGTCAVLVGLAAVDRPARLGSTGVALVVGAAVLSLVGGLVVAAGYGSASRRVR
jgi:hypothetical protein